MNWHHSHDARHALHQYRLHTHSLPHVTVPCRHRRPYQIGGLTTSTIYGLFLAVECNNRLGFFQLKARLHQKQPHDQRRRGQVLWHGSYPPHRAHHLPDVMSHAEAIPEHCAGHQGQRAAFHLLQPHRRGLLTANRADDPVHPDVLRCEKDVMKDGSAAWPVATRHR